MKYLVDFKNTATDIEIQDYLTTNGCTVLKEWDNFDKVFLVEVSSAPPVTDIIEHVVLEEGVAITPHYDINQYWGRHDDPNTESITINTADEKDWWKNYSYEQPVFDQPSYTINRYGKNISVYVMDSGLNKDSPEFDGVDVKYIYSVLGNDYTDCNGHGTSMAALISGRTCGITNATIKVVKIFDDNHATMQSEFLTALDAIISDYDKTKFAIINCSFTIPKNEWIESKFRALNNEGVYIVASAGNNGVEIEDITPASMPEAVTVGAYNQDLQPCSFSNYSDLQTSDQLGSTNHGELDGWAPGQKIWTYGLGYGMCQGTSPAAAITSAVIANNLHRYCGDTGIRLPFTHDWNLNTLNPNAMMSLVFGRKDLLDLSDPKYATSVNRIASIKDFSNHTNAPPTDEFNLSVLVGAKGEQCVLGMIADPKTTKSITDVTPMPNFCQIMPHGMLYAEPKEADGPAVGEVYKQYTWQFNRTNLDDITELCTVNIYVLHANYQPSDLPEDHVINISLAVNCWQGFYITSCSLDWFYATCINNCPNGGCCYHLLKGSGFCECQG